MPQWNRRASETQGTSDLRVQVQGSRSAAPKRVRWEYQYTTTNRNERVGNINTRPPIGASLTEGYHFAAGGNRQGSHAVVVGVEHANVPWGCGGEQLPVTIGLIRAPHGHYTLIILIKRGD
eukprot:4937131-Pyramimonas_sp.AAC.1